MIYAVVSTHSSFKPVIPKIAHFRNTTTHTIKKIIHNSLYLKKRTIVVTTFILNFGLIKKIQALKI